MDFADRPRSMPSISIRYAGKPSCTVAMSSSLRMPVGQVVGELARRPVDDARASRQRQATAATRRQTHPPHHSSSAASTVFSISVATVIGPTPPGTGVIHDARSRGRREFHVAGQRPSARSVDADVDDHRARLDPVAFHQTGSADRHGDDIAAGNHICKVAREFMAANRRAAGQQQLQRERPADVIGNADDHRRAATHRPIGCAPAASSRLSDVHGRKPRWRSASWPMFSGWNPSTSLRGSMRLISGGASICGGSGSCTRMPCTSGSALSLVDQRGQFVLSRRRGQIVVARAKSDVLAGAPLVPHVHGRGRIVADEDHRQTGRTLAGCNALLHACFEGIEQVVGDALAVENACGHADAVGERGCVLSPLRRAR